ncbi:glycosyltransferase [Salipiger bermudensis]|uniref:glycosyltransferase family 4 protein n=1 Tax=Salipiger bermudensis TaxID=344736 RepID=UPI001C993CF6|nr:glycosyltransferase [Salipiger bermudensis]MBY6004239.1 glycosyltransferase [Salipiger bermudensis]
MRLLVLAHRLELGGTQLNAIELAAQLQYAHGFDVTVHATEGPALAHLRARGLRYVPAPDARFHPSPERIRALRALAREQQPDLIHAWDWWQGLEAYLGAHLPQRTPLIITDMMMELTRCMPRLVPTTFGFAGLKEQAVRAGWRETHLLLPPIDTVTNAPGVVDGKAFRQGLSMRRSELLLVSVSRLAEVMKAEPLVRAIAAVREHGAALPLKLAIVGDGQARGRLEALADEANRHLGREAIVFTGAMDDPRPAYAAADVVLGMGGSALRGLAFAKPVVVLGEQGFALTFGPETAARFERTGMFGSGGTISLAEEIGALAGNGPLRRELGRFGRNYVVAHHGLEALADGFAALCRRATETHPSRLAQAGDAARSAFWYLRERRFRVASRDATAAESRARPGGGQGDVAPRLGRARRS